MSKLIIKWVPIVLTKYFGWLGYMYGSRGYVKMTNIIIIYIQVIHKHNKWCDITLNKAKLIFSSICITFENRNWNWKYDLLWKFAPKVMLICGAYKTKLNYIDKVIPYAYRYTCWNKSNIGNLSLTQQIYIMPKIIHK